MPQYSAPMGSIICYSVFKLAPTITEHAIVHILQLYRDRIPIITIIILLWVDIGILPINKQGVLTYLRQKS